MHLIYLNPEETSIKVTLDADENIKHLNGPIVATVPVDPKNAHYSEIVKQGLMIEPFAPPRGAPQVEIPSPTSLDAHPTDAMHAATKQYVDEQIAQLKGD